MCPRVHGCKLSAISLKTLLGKPRNFLFCLPEQRTKGVSGICQSFSRVPASKLPASSSNYTVMCNPQWRLENLGPWANPMPCPAVSLSVAHTLRAASEVEALGVWGCWKQVAMILTDFHALFLKAIFPCTFFPLGGEYLICSSQGCHPMQPGCRTWYKCFLWLTRPHYNAASLKAGHRSVCCGSVCLIVSGDAHSPFPSLPTAC